MRKTLAAEGMEREEETMYRAETEKKEEEINRVEIEEEEEERYSIAELVAPSPLSTGPVINVMCFLRPGQLKHSRVS